MRSRRLARRPALTMVEVLVLIAILALLLALLVSAVQAVRESYNRTRCQNNLRQLAVAVHHFHETKNTLPTYFGIYPPAKDRVEPWRDRTRVYGSWYAHLLPFVEEENLHRLLTEEIQANQYNERRSYLEEEGPPPSGPMINTATLEQNGKAYTYNYVTYDDPGSRRFGFENHGIWIDEAKGKTFPGLVCPSDPSPGAEPRAGVGQVYLDQNPPWGSTNYLANWHAFGSGERGLWTPPQRLTAISSGDGLSNTILFAEGYAWCDDRGRIALYSWAYHNFGLTWALHNVQLPPGSPPISFPNGMPNTLLFQVRPKALSFASCPDGATCCDNWRAQTPHSVMNVALADGSVRALAAGVTQRTWDSALLPRDGTSPAADDW